MHKLEIETEIRDYRRYVKAEGPHSKLGKYYRRAIEKLEHFSTYFNQFRSDTTFEPKSLTDQEWLLQFEALPHAHEAMTRGARMQIFRSGEGLRVVSLRQEEQEVGYGESPFIEDALVLADRDIQAGGKKYREVYGVDYPHFYIGSNEPSSPLDEWILGGNSIDVWHDGVNVVARLNGWEHTEFPENLRNQVMATGEPSTWSTQRGYTYKMESYTFPNGDLGVTAGIVSPVDEEKADVAWTFPIAKVGRGSTFHEAVAAALIASPVEVGI